MSPKPLMPKTHSAVFFVLLVCITLAPLVNIGLVKAAPLTVIISPTSGPTGTTINVTGTGATADGEVRIYMAMFFLGFFAATTDANSTGGFVANITTPALPAGSYSVLAHDIATGDTGTATFTIESSIDINIEEGSTNDEVVVKGYGFASDSLFNVTFDGAIVTPMPSPRTDNFGSFTVKIHVPSRPTGAYPIEASDGVNTASTSFTVLPKITLHRTSGPAATTVFVNGTGFAPSVDVSILFAEINVTMYPSFPTNPNGVFTHLFLVPDLPDGVYTITAIDENDNSARAPFTIPGPILTLTPNTTSGATLIIATGTGFPPKAPIALYLESLFTVDFIDLMIQSETLLTDEYGSYEYSFLAPMTTPGTYTVAAHAIIQGPGPGFVGEELASASLTIIEDALLIEIADQIASIVIPELGIIKTNLAALDAKLVNIEGTIATMNSTIGLLQTDIENIQLEVIAINESIATIQTNLGTLEGTITSIEDDTATIETDVGTIQADISNVQTDMSTIKNEQNSQNLLLYGTLALAAVSAIAAIILLVMHANVLRKTAKR